MVNPGFLTLTGTSKKYSYQDSWSGGFKTSRSELVRILLMLKILVFSQNRSTFLRKHGWYFYTKNALSELNPPLHLFSNEQIETKIRNWGAKNEKNGCFGFLKELRLLGSKMALLTNLAWTQFQWTFILDRSLPFRWNAML